MICVTFARGGSKGVIGKNIKLFSGKPLIEWTIKQGLSIDPLCRHFVSTDSRTIGHISLCAGADVPFMRPGNLSDDRSPELGAWQHFCQYMIGENLAALSDLLVVLPCTSPTRRREDILKAIEVYRKNRYDMVIGVTPSSKHPTFNMVTLSSAGTVSLYDKSGLSFVRRQDAPQVFDITTCFYVTSFNHALNTTRVLDGKVGSVIVEKQYAMDIDTELDFQLAQFLFERQKNE